MLLKGFIMSESVYQFHTNTQQIYTNYAIRKIAPVSTSPNFNVSHCPRPTSYPQSPTCHKVCETHTNAHFGGCSSCLGLTHDAAAIKSKQNARFDYETLKNGLECLVLHKMYNFFPSPWPPNRQRCERHQWIEADDHLRSFLFSLHITEASNTATYTIRFENDINFIIKVILNSAITRETIHTMSNGVVAEPSLHSLLLVRIKYKYKKPATVTSIRPVLARDRSRLRRWRTNAWIGFCVWWRADNDLSSILERIKFVLWLEMNSRCHPMVTRMRNGFCWGSRIRFVFDQVACILILWFIDILTNLYLLLSISAGEHVNLQTTINLSKVKVKTW